MTLNDVKSTNLAEVSAETLIDLVHEWETRRIAMGLKNCVADAVQIIPVLLEAYRRWLIAITDQPQLSVQDVPRYPSDPPVPSSDQ